MPAKPSGEIKTSIIHVPQKNDDIYVMEHQTIYDSIKKYNRILGSKLISKIPKGEKQRPRQDRNHLRGTNLIESQESCQPLECLLG